MRSFTWLACTAALAACGATMSDPTAPSGSSKNAAPGSVADGGATPPASSSEAGSDAGADGSGDDAGSDADGGESDSSTGSDGDGGSTTTSPGCGLTPSTTGFVANRTIDVDGTTRRYDLFVPPGYAATTPMPVVFVFHADVAVSIRPSFPIESASGGQAIVVYPYGFGGWDLGPSATNADQRFIEALAASLEASYCIDPARRFGYGYSNGGFFLNLMACFDTPFFRAIAVNSASIYAPDGEPVTYDADGYPICPATAAMVIHGTSDNTVKYTDGLYARDTWRAANGSDTTSSSFGPSPCVKYAGGGQPTAFCGFAGGHVIWTSAATASWAFFSSL